MDHSHTGAQVKMNNPIKALGRRAASRLLKPIVRPIVKNDLKPMVEQIVKTNLKPIVKPMLKDYLEQQAGGNAHTPHGGNARDLRVLTRLTTSDTFQNFFMAAPILLSCITLWRELRSDDERKETEQERRERESTKARKDNTNQMFDKWSSIAPSREAVLNKTYKGNWFSKLRKLLGMADKSKADETTPAPDSVDDVIQFFIRWKNHHDNKTINSVDLRKYLGSRFRTFHDILTKIHDDEAREWDEADLNNLNEVVDFLDEISKMKMDR